VNGAAPAKKKTTLAELDEGARQRHGSRSPMARSRSLGADADVRAQIDRLKGTTRQSRLRGIAALLPAQRSAGPSRSTTDRAYDVGAPIRMSAAYAGAFAASAATHAGEPSWLSPAYGAEDEYSTSAFAVEVYDAEADPQPAVVPARWPAPAEAPDRFDVATGQTDGGVPSLDLSAAAAEDAVESEQFEREIQALLSGKTVRHAPQGAAMAAAPASRPSPTPPPVAASRSHAVFEQMGQNMTYATAFHLPAMELGRRLDDLEAAVLEDDAIEARRPVREFSLELTDADISESLGLGGTAATSVTCPAVPASPHAAPVAEVVLPPITTDPTLHSAENGRPTP
jgi:hypothetical protein